MSRTIESHREYAQRWASTWERQAAVRTRPIGEGSPILRGHCSMSQPGRGVSESDA